MNRYKNYYKYIRLYLEEIPTLTESFYIDKKHANYLFNVMRLKAGAFIRIFKSDGYEYIAEIIKISKYEICVKVLDNIVVEPVIKPELKLVYVFAPVKKTKQEYIAQKVTELGVDEILPMRTQHTIIKSFNDTKFYANIIEATEQSERLFLPKLHELQDMLSCVSQMQDGIVLWLNESGQSKPIYQAVKDIKDENLLQQYANKLYIVVGPEGGFNEIERTMLKNQKNIIPISMGKNILRSETAGLAAISVVQATIGQWLNTHPRQQYIAI